MGTYSNIDTSEYRLAIWNYIHALFGIRHDDYEYNKVRKIKDQLYFSLSHVLFLRLFVDSSCEYTSEVLFELLDLIVHSISEVCP